MSPLRSLQLCAVLTCTAVIGASCGSDDDAAPDSVVPPSSAASSSTSSSVAAPATNTSTSSSSAPGTSSTTPAATATTTTTATNTTEGPPADTAPADTAPASTAPASTTSAPLTPFPPPESLALIDTDVPSFAGWPAERVDLVERATDILGAPTADTGWQPMPPKLACTGNLDYRAVYWGDLRIVNERSTPGAAPTTEAWTLGVGQPLAPARTEEFDLSPATGITTTGGVGLGDPVDSIEFDNVFGNEPGSPTYFIPGTRVLRIEVDTDGNIVGFSSGRNDCIGLDISTIPCGRPVPVFTLPDGTPTGEASIDDGTAMWGVETAGPNGENVVTEFIGGAAQVSQDELVNASQAPINAQSGQLDVRLVPTGDPVVGGASVFLFDNRTPCIRLLRLGPGLDAAEWQTYVDALAAQLNPQL